MSWELRYRRQGDWGAWQAARRGAVEELPEGACWWVLTLQGGGCDFELRCTLQPEPYQPPGR